jgi:hypothetical protein
MVNDVHVFWLNIGLIYLQIIKFLKECNFYDELEIHFASCLREIQLLD